MKPLLTLYSREHVLYVADDRCDIDMPGGKRMADGVNQKIGTNEEVRAAFQGWDPRIDTMLAHVENVLEWRVGHTGSEEQCRKLFVGSILPRLDTSVMRVV